MSVRHPPRTYSYTTGGGVCRWCEEPILRAGVQCKKMRWHPKCAEIWLIATSSAAARHACRERDHGVCRVCGYACEAPSNYRVKPRGAGFQISGRVVRSKFIPVMHETDWVEVEYCEIHYAQIRPWIADHIVPLWSVDRTDPEAIRFWMIGNLQTLCQVCSDAKTADEAGMRAKELRIRQKAAGVETRKYKRKIPSRPFGTEHRPLRGRR